MRGVDAQRLHTGQPERPTNAPVIGDRPIAKHPRQQSEGMIGQRRIDERPLTVEGFRGATTREKISVNVRLGSLRGRVRKLYAAGACSLVPSIQRLPKHKLTAVGVVAQIQPVIDFTPVLCALCNGCASFPSVDTAD